MENKIPQIGTKEFNDLASACFGGKPKQETLEEVAENYAEKWNDLENQFKLSSCFIAGAKWQQERSYSEEEVLNILDIMLSEYRDSLENKTDFYPALRFEQFKNK
jgi:hypothetical protein